MSRAVSPALRDRTVVVTRSPEQSGELARLLAAEGARVVEVPTLALVSVGGEERAAAEAAVRAAVAGTYDGIVLTSSNAAGFFHELVLATGNDASALGDVELFAIGPATARALVERGYRAPTQPREAIAEGLLATVREVLADEVPGKRLLLPRAREGRDVLIAGLRAAGAHIDVVVLYETRALTNGPGLPADGRVDWVTFASPSAARAFVQRFGDVGAKVACIGPVTAKAAEELGLRVAAVGEEHTAAGLVAAIVAAAGS